MSEPFPQPDPDQFALGLRVFAQFGCNAQQLDLRHCLKTFANLQAGGAGLPVDEYLGHCFFQKNS